MSVFNEVSNVDVNEFSEKPGGKVPEKVGSKNGSPGHSNVPAREDHIHQIGADVGSGGTGPPGPTGPAGPAGPTGPAGTVSFGSVVSEFTFGSSSTSGAATTAIRSDHTHGNPTHDATAHSTIPLNTFAPAAANVNMGGFRVTNVGTPTSGTDAANKNYVDAAIAGLSWKQPVDAASTGVLTLSGTQTVDGIALVVGDRVLVKDQGINLHLNGIYIVASGAWTRATDADVGAELVNASVFVKAGTVNLDTAWVCISDSPITIGVTGLIWAQFSGAGIINAGNGLVQTGMVFHVVAADSSLVVAADSITRGALTGDVTSAQGSNATAITNLAVTTAKIANDAVDNTKLTNMTTQTIKGRATGGTGDPEDLTSNQVRSILGYPAGVGNVIGAGTSVLFNHGLGTRYVLVTVYRNSPPYDEVECDIEHTDINNITLKFATAVAANEYAASVVGL